MNRPAMLVASILLAFSASFAHAANAGTSCEHLSALTIPDVKVLHTDEVAAGSFMPPGAKLGLETPAFCRVQIEAHPTPDSNIRIEVWLPSAETWNGKFEGVGNGGYQGNITYAAMATALKEGYATAATDTGHEGESLAFGENHPEKVIDWSYRSIHLTAEIGKLVVRDHFGRNPTHSYFVGCSTGGHQALSEAQRFPEDYDGILAGDPAYDRVHQTAAFLWSWKATHDDSGAPLFTPAQLKFVTQSAITACDAIDGIKDGIIADPRKCKFDPATLACKDGAKSDSCLSTQQVDALKKVYAGTWNPRTHEQIFPGWSVGSEGFGATAAQGWGAYILNPKQPMRIEVFSYFLFNDPNWDWHTFDFDHDMAFADQKIGYMAAVNPDLSGFRARGGKLLMTTGWSDPVAAPLDVMKYYTTALAKNGGIDRTKEFFRFFMAPGMGHCGGGPGPNTFDSLSALNTWVEDGKAPTRIVASHSTDGKIDRTRPLCAFPEVAAWKGTGSKDDAANFVCRVAP